MNINNGLRFTCEIQKLSKEIDSVGHFREPLNLVEGQISFNNGISSLEQYVTAKKKKDKASKNYILNDFTCPILFKNFKENIIPENKAVLCEIKSGFAIEDVSNQINDRINFLTNCLFNKGEKPEYFIGIVNLASENLNKLKQLSEKELNFKEKVLIISAVDYEYHGIDISVEVNPDYLLFKKIDNLESKLDGLKKEMEAQKKEREAQKKEREAQKKELKLEMEAQKKEMADYFDRLNSKLDLILTQISSSG